MRNRLEVDDAEMLSAEPVKEFFVEMLTRDIALDDAILDLLDNCVDGVVTTIGKQGLRADNPYHGYYAHITVNQKQFVVEDNCGGIPDKRKDYAFRMGAHPDGRDLKLPTVGTYGIGMKRAMFKMGKDCLVETKSKSSEYSVRFAQSWFEKPDEWRVPLSHAQTNLKQAGTRITVSVLRDGVRTQFGQQGFINDLQERIATHYALILAKGFEVKINGQTVIGKPLRLRFSEAPDGVRPFVFRGKLDGVEVFLAVGFTMPIPSEIEANGDAGAMAEGSYTSAEAGWTVVCNDRTVLYCDKSMLTGWGEPPVPNYHNQFIAVSGIVEFRSDDAAKLPTTTTKRGIDASSSLYLQTKVKMREGMKLFTDFTNRWKGERASEGKQMIRDAVPMGFSAIKEKAGNLKLRTVARFEAGQQYKPQLPQPPLETTDSARIAFSRPRGEVESLADRLFGDSETAPSLVGERCYEMILQRTR